MKKTLILGAAAVAAMGMISTADAGEVKMSGYYQFRVQNADSNTLDEANNDDDTNRWVHRLQLNMDFMASQKTHAHARVRMLDTALVQGSDVASINGNETSATGAWAVKQLWLETDLWGVGAKMGNMPLDFNDKLLVNNDTTSFGSIVLAKSFGDVTVALGNIRVAEGQDGSGVDTNANADDMDLYALTVLGKMNSVNYQVTGAYLYQGDSNTATAQDDNIDDWWLALTLGGNVSGVDLTGTAIYENGADVDGGTGLTQLEEDGFMLGLRAKGKAGFGGWNAYTFYADENYTNIVDGRAEWSPTWDMGGAGAQDLMAQAFGNAASSVGGTQLSNGGRNDIQNLWGIGAGLAIEASGWTIKPYLDYASVVETDYTGTSATDANIDSAWGGSLILSTKVDTDTTLDLSANYVDPDDTDTNTGYAKDSMHQLLATVTMKF